MLLFTLLAFYLGGMFWLYHFQRQILFHPNNKTKANKGFFLELSQGKVWVEVLCPGRKRALLYFPGNTEEFWQQPKVLSRISPWHSIYFLHYPGYGASDGQPSQEKLYQAALNLYDKIKTEHQYIDIVGRSLGSAVALHLAANRPTDHLVLITPFDSVVALAQRRYSIYPIRLLSKDPFEVIREAHKVKSKVLILLAENDKVTPHRHSNRLIDALKNAKKEIITIPKTTHADILESPTLFRAIHDFLRPSTAPNGV